MKFDHLLQSQEGKRLEFKRDISSPVNIMKTLVVFANTAGGIMLIGVENDRIIICIPGNPLDEEERISNMLADSIAPRLPPNIELVPSKNLTLLAVEVFPSQLRPHYLKQIGKQQGVFVRFGSTNRQADLQLDEELKRTVSGKGFDEQPLLEAAPDEIDFQTVAESFNTTRALTENDLEKLRLLTRVQGQLVPTVGGMLLFGKRRDFFFPDAWIQCVRFFGTEKIDIFDHIGIHAPLPKAVDDIMLFLKKHAMRGADLSEIRRKDIWSIPLSVQPVKQSSTNKAHDKAHDFSNTEKVIQQACRNGPLSSAQLLEALGYKSRIGNFKNALSRLLKKKLLARTIPDAPRSKNQKYRINN